MAEPERPGAVEATALAIAGPAFAAALLSLRHATPVGAGAFDGAAVALVALGGAPWLHRWKGAPLATLARGAGLAAGLLLLRSAVVPPFQDATIPAAVAVAGGALLQAGARGWRFASAVGVALLLAALALALVGASALPEPGRLRVALAVAALASAAGLVARRFLPRWLAPMPVGILLVSALGSVYLAYRSLAQAHIANLPLYEWSLATGGAALVLARLRRRAKERESPDAWTGAARRHAQDVRPVYDERMVVHAQAIASRRGAPHGDDRPRVR